MSRHRPLPDDVYGGDVILDDTGRGVVVNGIEGRVHLFFGENDGRTFMPKAAIKLAHSLMECAALMEETGHGHTDAETEALSRSASHARETADAAAHASEEAIRAAGAAEQAAAESVSLRQVVEGAAFARRHVSDAWKKGGGS